MEPTDFAEHLITMKDKIFRFSRSILCNHTEAQDVTQDIIEKFWRSKDSYCSRENIDAFIMTSVHNLCCDRLRKSKLRQAKQDEIKSEF